MRVSSKAPYWSGALAGLLLTCTVLAWSQYFSPVHVFAKVGSSLLHFFGHGRLDNLSFFTVENGANAYHNFFDFETCLLIGLFLGAFIASMLERSFKLTTEVPSLFYSRFGDKKILRFVFAFTGGLIMSVGAMMAAGCSISYGISAFARFDASGILTFSSFYFGGIIVNRIIYWKKK